MMTMIVIVLAVAALIFLCIAFPVVGAIVVHWALKSRKPLGNIVSAQLSGDIDVRDGISVDELNRIRRMFSEDYHAERDLQTKERMMRVAQGPATV